LLAIEFYALISAGFEYASQHPIATAGLVTTLFVALKKTGKAIAAFDRFQIDYRIERRKKINKLRSMPYVSRTTRSRGRLARLGAILLIRATRRVSAKRTARVIGSETSKPRLES
jgi:hypothetical protein